MSNIKLAEYPYIMPVRQADGFHGPWPAPAKLNLLLRIVGRRADGYHELQTVFQFISVADQLFFKEHLDGEIIRNHSHHAITVETDLTLRAARLLQELTACPYGVTIKLEKNLPIGAGLGGGSSDAATTLVALNFLWQLHLSHAELLRIGLQLGADVPVFIGGETAWAEGVGEKLTPLQLPELWYIVVNPGCQVATREIFADEQLTRDSIPLTMLQFNDAVRSNDCLSVVVRLYPVVGKALGWLQRIQDNDPGIRHIGLTGTGACVFAECATRPVAAQILQAIPEGWRGFIAQGTSKSLLASAIAGGCVRQ